MISATIKRNVAIQTKLDVQKPKERMTFAAGVKPPRQRKTSTAWPKEFEDIKAPVQRFVNADGNTVRPVSADGTELKSRDGTFFLPVPQEDGSTTLEAVGDEDVQFLDEAGEVWTLQGVQEVADYDYLEVSGTAEELQKVYNAVQRFSKSTGKGLIVRHAKEETDAAGNTFRMTKNIIRIR
jgi:hypothetical protein